MHAVSLHPVLLLEPLLEPVLLDHFMRGQADGEMFSAAIGSVGVGCHPPTT